MSANGEIPNHLAESFKIFSLVKLTEVEPCPDKAHTEDVHCSRMEISPFELLPTKAFLNQLLDTQHQTVFYYRGKAIPATIIDRLNYSLMLIQPKNVSAYCDEERENSKYRMKFTYFGSNYDFPITDPVFLEQFIFEQDEIEHERGVILEEWRGGLGAQERLRKATWPIMLKGSKYADRLPIGLEEVIRTFQRPSSPVSTTTGTAPTCRPW